MRIAIRIQAPGSDKGRRCSGRRTNEHAPHRGVVGPLRIFGDLVNFNLAASAGSAAVRKTVEVAGETVAYTSTGQGPDVLLIHGALVTLDDLILALGGMADEFRLVAVDRPGHGGSSRKPPDASLWRQAAILREASITLGLSRPVVVGHSYGGGVALAYAMQFPDEVSGVVAMAPICFPEVRLEHALFGPRATPLVGKYWAAWADKTSDRALMPALWRAMFLPQAMPEEFERLFPFQLAALSTGSPVEGEEAMMLMSDLGQSAMRYSRLRVPVAILGGDRDIVVNNHIHGVLAAAMIPGAVYETVPGSGHMLHHFHQDRVIERVRAFARPAEAVPRRASA